MQPAPRPLSEQPLGEPPLPPATTHHVEFPEPAEEATLAAPFLPSAPTPYVAPYEPPAAVPGPDLPEEAALAADPSAPLPWEEADTEAAPQLTWDGVPTVEPESFQAAEAGAEPLMPWEEYLSLGEAADAADAADAAEAGPEFGGELGDLDSLATAATDDAAPEPWAELAPADASWALPASEVETGEAAPAWGDEATPPEAAGFPLDAFIVPSNAHRPSGMEEGLREQAEALAVRLEALAARLRVEGFIPLVRPAADAQPIDQLIATLLAGYISR